MKGMKMIKEYWNTFKAEAAENPRFTMVQLAYVALTAFILGWVIF